MPMPPILRNSALALCLALPTPGWAEPPIRADDRARIEAFDTSFGRAMHQALSGGDPADIVRLTTAMRGTAMPPMQARKALPGEWSCQMIKLGGIAPLVVYQPFTCRITGNEFQKLTGSQRSKGRIYADQDRLIYLGTSYIAGDTAPDYADLPIKTDPQVMPQRLPDVGVIEAVSPKRARILFPSPHLESDLNLLYLTR